MKKSLIALAVAGAFAPAAFAATSNVDVYGVLNVAVESVDNGTVDKTRVTTGNNSAIGFKGSEDLGGGLKGVWQVETNVSVDGDNNGTNSAGVGALNGTRNTYLGVAGGFGTVIFGVHDTPYKTATGGLDPFGATLGDYNSIMGAYSSAADATTGNASAQFDLRTGNTIAYVSPNISGFQAVLGYVLSSDNNFGDNTTFNEAHAWSINASYTNGPLFLAAAYEDHTLKGNTGTGGGVAILGNGSDTHSTERDAWKIGAGYKFGDLSLGLIYESIDVSKNTLSPASVGDRDAWHVNAAYAMGPITLKAAYTNADDFGSRASTGATQWNLGVDYALSKRTKAYFVYANLDNDANARYTLGQGSNGVNSGAASTTGVGGKDQDGFAIGLSHSF